MGHDGVVCSLSTYQKLKNLLISFPVGLARWKDTEMKYFPTGWDY